MPIYLLHGFKWHRQAISIHVILKNLDEVAPDWLLAPGTSKALIQNFNHIYPRMMAFLPELRFIEQYDPNDLSTKTQPFAYVADVVREIKLGEDIDEIRGARRPYEQWEAFLQLRDQLAEGEKVAWYVVYCGDEERSFSPPSTPTTEGFSRTSMTSWGGDAHTDTTMTSYSTNGRSAREEFPKERTRRKSFSRSFRKVFGGGGTNNGGGSSGSMKKTRSLKDLKSASGMRSFISGRSASPPPPLPPPLPPGTSYRIKPGTPGTAR